MYSYFFYPLALVLPLLYLFRRRALSHTPSRPAITTTSSDDKSSLKTIMQAPRTDLDPPKNDPFTLGDLAQFDGTDPSKPIYVSIKGNRFPPTYSHTCTLLIHTHSAGVVFDVTRKRDVYGPGGSYSIFAGKDGSRGLGMSSLKPEDAVPDYSALPENERKVLDDWHAFFEYVLLCW